MIEFVEDGFRWDLVSGDITLRPAHLSVVDLLRGEGDFFYKKWRRGEFFRSQLEKIW